MLKSIASENNVGTCSCPHHMKRACIVFFFFLVFGLTAAVPTGRQLHQGKNKPVPPVRTPLRGRFSRIPWRRNASCCLLAVCVVLGRCCSYRCWSGSERFEAGTTVVPCSPEFEVWVAECRTEGSLSLTLSVTKKRGMLWCYWSHLHNPQL